MTGENGTLAQGSLLPCPTCGAAPGEKVGPPRMIRCITLGCSGKGLAAMTLAEWTLHAAPPQRDKLKPFKSLINEVAGVWDAFEIGLRHEISNTNYAVVKEKLVEAESALEAMLRPAAGEDTDRIIAGLNKQLTEQFELSTKYVGLGDRYFQALKTIERTTFSGSDMNDDYMRGNRHAHETCAKIARAALAPDAPSPADKAPVSYETWMETVRLYNRVKAELRELREAIATIPPVTATERGHG